MRCSAASAKSSLRPAGDSAVSASFFCAWRQWLQGNFARLGHRADSIFWGEHFDVFVFAQASSECNLNRLMKIRWLRPFT